MFAACLSGDHRFRSRKGAKAVAAPKAAPKTGDPLPLAIGGITLIALLAAGGACLAARRRS